MLNAIAVSSPQRAQEEWCIKLRKADFPGCTLSLRSVAAVELSARPHLAQDPTTADVDVVGAVQVGGVVVT